MLTVRTMKLFFFPVNIILLILLYYVCTCSFNCNSDRKFVLSFNNYDIILSHLIPAELDTDVQTSSIDHIREEQLDSHSISHRSSIGKSVGVRNRQKLHFCWSNASCVWRCRPLTRVSEEMEGH